MNYRTGGVKTHSIINILNTTCRVAQWSPPRPFSRSYSVFLQAARARRNNIVFTNRFTISVISLFVIISYHCRVVVAVVCVSVCVWCTLAVRVSFTIIRNSRNWQRQTVGVDHDALSPSCLDKPFSSQRSSTYPRFSRQPGSVFLVVAVVRSWSLTTS